MRSAGTCAHPIRLVGSRDVIESATGELLDSTGQQQITVWCGNRRASVCAYCSTLYKFDAYNLVAAGLRGGKDMPPNVAGHPRLFVTLTAPSFGPVHLGPGKDGQLRPCKPRRDGSGCKLWHRADDPLIGTPLDPSGYDYQGHVLFNAMAGKLWSKTANEIRRSVAKLLGLSRHAGEQMVSVNFAKVAEYQARGVVHFHGVARLDGPDGAASPPPSGVTVQLLDAAIRDAVARVAVEVPESRALGAPGRRLGSAARHSRRSARVTSTLPQSSRTCRWRGTSPSTPPSPPSRPVSNCLRSPAAPAPAPAERLVRSPDRDDVLLPCRTCSGSGRTIDLDSLGALRPRAAADRNLLAG